MYIKLYASIEEITNHEDYSFTLKGYVWKATISDTGTRHTLQERVFYFTKTITLVKPINLYSELLHVENQEKTMRAMIGYPMEDIISFCKDHEKFLVDKNHNLKLKNDINL